MSPRTSGRLLILYAVLSAVLAWMHLQVPFFKIPFIAGNVAGWVVVTLLLAAGVWLVRKGKHWNLSPLTRKKLQRFRAIRRGYISFLILLGLAGIASLDTLIVGKRALLVRYNGQLYVPFVREIIPGKTFGLTYDGETDYRELQKKLKAENQGNWVILPIVRFANTLDSPQIIETLEMRGDKLFRVGNKEAFSGTAYLVFKSKPEQKRQEFMFRNGLRHGDMRGWNEAGGQVEKGRYEKGRQLSYVDYSNGKAPALEALTAPEWRRFVYPPSPPSLRHKHYLGTNSNGVDVLAMLFGGWQQALAAALLYLPVVFGIGVLMGGLLGYFGGVVDLFGQRLIEIWSVLPFLFIVMIVSMLVTPTLVVLVIILAAFGWMGTTIYLRTATYKEKARDYVASARLLGASTPRIIFHHVLPNVIAILVTLAPFEISGVITALAALDFLGFGLPPDVPSWGRLLHEGVENFNYPWIVSSAFVAMALVLVLVTFVGEAVREAFDPKKFSTYQ
ncbi:MAG: ABC transporter permease subunit [Prosthecobacter sp.]|nr:ABC transporter permease subunit [Prosthecobacter sp.]